MAAVKNIILIPEYNDWDALVILINQLGQVCSTIDLPTSIIVIDDGSTVESGDLRLGIKKSKYLLDIEILHLARNLGHQKAIAIGLSHIYKHHKGSRVIVMDCDGEDKPDDIPAILEAHRSSPKQIIFAQRNRRSEGLIFRIFYSIYKLIFLILTGNRITFGNFALIPPAILSKVVYLPEIWNHFAAGIIHAQIPRQTIPSERGKRYIGKSKMNFVSLILHGLSSMSVFIEIIAARLIMFSIFIIILVLLTLIVVLYFKYFTVLAIPGWATSVSIGLIIVTLQTITILTLLSFVVLSYRTNKLFIPIKDFEDYVFSVEKLDRR
jgi:glycosyltransferase involved in cell wall biosynthesis